MFKNRRIIRQLREELKTLRAYTDVLESLAASDARYIEQLEQLKKLSSEYVDALEAKVNELHSELVAARQAKVDDALRKPVDVTI